MAAPGGGLVPSATASGATLSPSSDEFQRELVRQKHGVYFQGAGEISFGHVRRLKFGEASSEYREVTLKNDSTSDMQVRILTHDWKGRQPCHSRPFTPGVSPLAPPRLYISF